MAVNQNSNMILWMSAGTQVSVYYVRPWALKELCTDMY